ncbi:MAG: bacteriophage abortive infection AbiH family protein [Desulfuromonadales bacterium]|nr:bacteriophage abortive infection AbiH family protein [Desulfuromonadales bacterium]
MNDKKLYIIGNGFDLYHKMKTSYSDFNEYIAKNNVELESFFGNYFNFETNKNYLWENFEYDLGTFDWEVFFQDNDNISPLSDNEDLGKYYEVHDDINEQLESITKEISDALYNWISKAEKDYYLQLPKIKLLTISKNDLYLSFNYTDTLNKMYKIPDFNVLHIHKCIKKSPDTLIFGHNQDVELDQDDPEAFAGGLTYAIDSAKLLYSTLKKPTDEIIEDNIDFFDNLSSISEIIVLGHSMNEIDLPYYKKIRGVVDDSTLWRVSYYWPEEENALKQILISIGIEESHIYMFKMQNLSDESI